MSAVNPIFDQPGASFTFLRFGNKFPPIEKEWQKTPHTFAEAVAHSGNVGVVAGNGYIGLDQDDPTAFEGIELPITTTWETRPGRLGMWFTCEDRNPVLLARYGKKGDTAQLKLFKDGKPVGEVKLERTYQVIPPSWKDLYYRNGEEVSSEDYFKGLKLGIAGMCSDDERRRVFYKILQKAPPADISLEWLLSELQRIGINFSSKLDQNAAKLEGIAKAAKKVKIEPDEDRTRRYALAALQKETDILASTPTGDRNNQLNKSSYNLGQFVGAGVLSRDEVVAALVLAADDVEIPDDEMKKTIDSGLSAGKLKPREIPAPTHKPQTDIDPSDSEDIIEDDVCDIIPHTEINAAGEEYEWEEIHFNHAKAVDSILNKLPVVQGVDDNLYYWLGSTWTDKAESIIFNKLHRIAGKHFTMRYQKEVIIGIRHMLAFSRAKFDSNPYLLGVKNGVVDLRTKWFRDYEKEDHISLSIETVFDVNAKCPGFIKFLEEVCPNVTDRVMLVDWLALHAFGKAFPYVLFLVGRGRNGKGVYEAVLQALYSVASFSFMTLDEIQQSNFAKGNLIGKRGLIISEISDETKKGKGVIKTHFLKLASGDGYIDSDRKNKERILFPPTFKATIDTNDMPIIADTSKGWEERFCKADMPFLFVDNPDPKSPKERLKNPHLKHELTTSKELSGILNLIIERAFEIAKTERITKRSGADYMAEYKVQSGSVKEFIERYCEYCPKGPHGEPITEGWRLDAVYQAYVAWVTHPAINGDLAKPDQFGKQVNKFCPGAESKKQRDEQGKQSKQYLGFMFFEEKHKEDMKSLSAPLAPLSSTKAPLESLSAPLAPLNIDIWNSIREKFSLDLVPIGNTTCSQKMGFSGAVERIAKFEEPISQKSLSAPTIHQKPENLDQARCESVDGPKMGKINRPTPVAKKVHESWKDPRDISDENYQNNALDTVAMEEPKRTDDNKPFSSEYFDSVLTCRRIKKALAAGVTGPLELSEAVGLPVCLLAKLRGANSIASADVLGRLEEHRKNLHFRGQADRLMTRPKEQVKKIHSISEMAAWVPPDNSSPEAAKICRVFCVLLKRGIAPQVDLLVEMTGLPEEKVRTCLDGAPWIRKDNSSPAGIVVYLPVEAKILVEQGIAEIVEGTC